MPLLNPGIVVLSPYLSDSVYITHRDETVTDGGRSTWVPSDPCYAGAIVTVAGPNDLERLPEADRSKRVMMFITNAQVRPVSPNAKPDLITWPADDPVTRADYLVLNVAPYPRYGMGWYQVMACSQDVIDAPL